MSKPSARLGARSTYTGIVAGEFSFEHQIEWDKTKAAANLLKHAVSFDIAATVLLDPLNRTIPDLAHSETEERWVTIGRAVTGA